MRKNSKADEICCFVAKFNVMEEIKLKTFNKQGSGSASEQTNESVSNEIERWKDGKRDGWMDKWMDGPTEERITEGMAGWMDRQTDFYVIRYEDK